MDQLQREKLSQALTDVAQDHNLDELIVIFKEKNSNQAAIIATPPMPKSSFMLAMLSMVIDTARKMATPQGMHEILVKLKIKQS